MIDKKLILRLQNINKYITKANTGTPKELAKKMNISERQLYSDIELMKKLGAPIGYCRRRCSYFYAVEGCFNIGFDDFTLPPPNLIIP